MKEVEVKFFEDYAIYKLTEKCDYAKYKDKFEFKIIEAKREKDITDLMERIPIISCNVPSQTNGTDCGLFLFRNLQMVMERLPYFTSNATDITNKFIGHFTEAAYPSSDVASMRTDAIDLLNRYIHMNYKFD
jgi:hypothetical protein